MTQSAGNDFVSGQFGDFLAVVFDRARRGFHQPREGSQSCGFPGAVRADQGDDAALWNLEADTVEGFDCAVGDVEIFDC